MLVLRTRYPLQVDTSDLVGYPQGKAQNVAVIGDGSGTPLEKDLVNDILGLQQSLAANAGITPSGTPDKVGASQQLDGIKFIAETSHCEFNITKFGGLINGVTDDTTAFRACVAALAAIGGGTVLVPYGAAGVCRLTDKIALPRGVSVYFVPGVQVLFDHATHDVFSWEATSSTGRGPDTIDNFWVEGEQINTGSIFKFTTYSEVILRNCRGNSVDGKMQGDILNQTVLAPVRFENCLLESVKAGGASYVLGGNVQFIGGGITAAGTVTTNLITGTGDLLLDDVTLSYFGLTVPIAFISQVTGLRTRVVGCRMERSGGVVGFLMEIAGISFAQVKGCDLNQTDGVESVYKYTSGALSTGSELQLRASSSTAVSAKTIGDEVSSMAIKFTGAIAPAVTMPHHLVSGRELDVVVYNAHGSGDWGPDFIIFNPQGSDAVQYAATGLDALPSGSAISIRFRSVVNPITSVDTWTQIGAHQLLS